MSTNNRQQNSLDLLIRELALDKKEAIVFLKLLDLGKATAGDLAKSNHKIARTSTYDVLKRLTNLGLVSSFIEDEKKYFQVQEVEHVVDMLETQKREIEEKQNLLRSVGDIVKQMKSGTAYHPMVRFFEGENGILAIHRELQNARKPTKTIVDIASVAKIFPHMVIEDNLKDFQTYKIPKHDLMVRSREAEKYLRAAPVNELHKVKWLPEDIKFQTDTFIWEGHVAILDYSSHLSGVIIDNPTIADTFVAWFELIWKGCGEEAGMKRGVL